MTPLHPVHARVWYDGRPGTITGLDERAPDDFAWVWLDGDYEPKSLYRKVLRSIPPRPYASPEGNGLLCVGQMVPNPTADSPHRETNQKLTLTREQAAVLAASLLHFARTGDLR